MKIIIAGGSGQVGTILARHFSRQQHEVVILSRREHASIGKTVAWDGMTLGPWVHELDGSDVLINLAGRSVNCRYGEANRLAILNSRVLSTQVLHDAVASIQKPPAVWLNASTATIYRHALDRAMDEVTGELGGREADAPDTWRFSIQVAKAWEEAFFSVATPRTRQVALRSAMTFSPDPEGVFDVFLRLVRYGLGGTTLPGNQFVSWIHEDDFARSIDFLIHNSNIDGVVNLASPNPLPNREFLRILRHAWGTSIGLPTSRWMLEVGAFLMRTESELVLKSRRVVPGRLLDAGFTFDFPTWPEAAKELVARWRQGSQDKRP
jgi:uncharacterized protein (TIGR01777 family)